MNYETESSLRLLLLLSRHLIPNLYGLFPVGIILVLPISQQYLSTKAHGASSCQSDPCVVMRDVGCVCVWGGRYVGAANWKCHKSKTRKEITSPAD